MNIKKRIAKSVWKLTDFKYYGDTIEYVMVSKDFFGTYKFKDKIKAYGIYQQRCSIINGKIKTNYKNSSFDLLSSSENFWIDKKSCRLLLVEKKYK